MEKENLEEKRDINIQLPFHNLFLNAGFISGTNSSVKYVFTILTTVLAYFTYQVFMGIVLIYFAQQSGVNIYDAKALAESFRNPQSLGVSKNFMTAMLLGMFVFTFWIFYVSIRRIHQKQFITVVSAYPQIRWHQVLFAFSTWAVVFLLMFLVDYLWISKDNYLLNFKLKEFIGLFLISVLLLPIQTSFEEIFFRGYLMQAFALVSKNGIFPLIFTSLLFGLAHMSNPEATQFGVWIMLPYYSLFGLFLGLLALWNNGLELAIGIHAANNILSALLITSKNSVLQTDAIFIIKHENPVNDFILWIVGAVVTLLIFQYKYKFKNHLQLLK